MFRRPLRSLLAVTPIVLTLLSSTPAQALPINEGDVIDWECVMMMGANGSSLQEAILLCTYTPAGHASGQLAFPNPGIVGDLLGGVGASSDGDHYIFSAPSGMFGGARDYFGWFGGPGLVDLFSTQTWSGERSENGLEGPWVPFTETTITSRVSGLSFATVSTEGNLRIAASTPTDALLQSFTALESGASIMIDPTVTGTELWTSWRYQANANTTFYGYMQINANQTIGSAIGLSLPNPTSFSTNSLSFGALTPIPEPSSVAALGGVAAVLHVARRGRTRR